MLDLFFDSFLKTTRWILILWLVWLGSCILLLLSPWTPREFDFAASPNWFQSLTYRLQVFKYQLIYQSSGNAAFTPTTSWDTLPRIILVATLSFSNYIKESFIAIFVIHCVSNYTVESFQTSAWLQELYDRFSLVVPDFFEITSASSRNEASDDSDLPPLEDIPGVSPLEVVGKTDWHVFHPTFGVIPQELIDRWSEEESQREELRQILIENKRPPPPIRFSEHLENNNEEEEEEERRESSLSEISEKELVRQSVALERTLSGFDAVGIE